MCACMCVFLLGGQTYKSITQAAHILVQLKLRSLCATLWNSGWINRSFVDGIVHTDTHLHIQNMKLESGSGGPLVHQTFTYRITASTVVCQKFGIQLSGRALIKTYFLETITQILILVLKPILYNGLYLLNNTPVCANHTHTRISLF